MKLLKKYYKIDNYTLDNKENFFLIIMFLIGALVLIYYFHVKLKTGTVFTHLFYIPIILASLWWNMAGLLVAISLGGALICSNILLQQNLSIFDDSFRALMFVIVSIFILYLKKQITHGIDIILLNNKKYRTLFDNMDNGVLLLKSVNNGENFIITDVNDAAERIDLLSHDEFIGKNIEELFPKIKDCGLFDVFQKVLKTGKSEKFPLSFYKDDRISGWRSSAVYQLSKNEIVCVYKDETEKIKAEEARIKLSAIVRSSNDSIIGVTTKGIIQTWNQGAENIFGYSAKEAIGSHVSIFVPKEYFDESSQIIEQVKNDKRVERYETVRLRKDGIKINVSITASPVKTHFNKIIGISVITRDITEKSRLEYQLRQAQKRQALGTLAGGIAHDFNNILSPIIGFTEMTLDTLPKDSLESKNLIQVLKASNRASELIEHILTFSRDSKQEKKSLKIQYIVKEVLKLIRATLPAKIKIRQNIQDCGFVLADPSQIHQIIMNLCTNAYHAMEAKGGIMEVSLKEVNFNPENYIGQLHLNPGMYVRLTISDTGCGMSSELVESIFDPYFTTKNQGNKKGTGLGLAIVQGIVKSYGGDISVYSELNTGTTFHVYFPRVLKKIESIKIEQTKPLPKGSERILLVDDEEQIVLMLSQMLKGLDYNVISTTDSRKAFKIFQEQPENFDLVITDHDMPDMAGAQLAKEIINIKPDMPVILCSGFSEFITEQKAKDIGIREFIMKPVSKKNLAETVRRVLA